MSFNGVSYSGNKYGEFHERLAYYVIRKNKRLHEITEATGISAGSITNWCSGRIKPKYENVEKLCDYLGISINTLRAKKKDEAKA